MQKIVPAILTDDLADFRKKLGLLRDVSEWVQIDVADGLFVPNVTLSPRELIGELAGFRAEIHLMTRDPESFFDACAAARAARVLFHVESVADPHAALETMKTREFARGLAVNPETPAESVTPYLSEIDSVLLLSVNPGFQGGTFIPSVLDKIREIKKTKPGMIIGVDGGIRTEHLAEVFGAGADYAVVGSALWREKDPVAIFRTMREMVS